METDPKSRSIAARKALWLSSLSVVALTMAATSSPVWAQASDQVETITVTAEKRSENIQNVPLSIIALSGEDLTNAGVFNPTQLAKVVPNLQVENISQAAGITFRIRGFGSNANAAIDPDVAPYVDTAYIPHPGAIVSDFLDVKSVEVLRGPQGTLFGRNAVMGAISITTNAPNTDATEFDLMGQGGSYGSVEGQAVANVPLSDDFAVRAAVDGSHTDGFWHNLFDGKTYGERDTEAGRLSAKWNITPNLTWILRVDGAAMNGDGLNPLALATNSATPAQLATLNAGLAHFGGTPPVESYPPSFTINQRFEDPSLIDTQYGVTSDVGWTVSPDIMLRLIDTFRSWSDAQTDGDDLFFTLDLLNRQETFGSKAQSHELQVVTPKGAFFDSKLGFTAGLYYSEEDYNLNEIIDLGSQLCTLVYAAHPGLVGPCNAAPQTAATQAPFGQHSTSAAAYAQANYQILPNLELDVGARQTWDDKTGHFEQIVLNPYVGAGVLRAPENDPSLKFNDSRPSWLASLSWHLNDQVMTYATFSTGYKSGGFNSGTTSVALTPATRTFGSETSDDYEVGVKSIWFNNTLLLNADLFDTQLQNFQDRSFNGTTGFLIRNAGNVRSRGLETEGQIRAIDHLNLNFGLGYLDSIYASDTGAPEFDGCSATIINAACPGHQNLSDRQLPFAPKWQGDVGIEADSDPFLGGFMGNVSLTENFTSSYQSENTDSQQTIVAGYATTDARVSFFSPDAKWQLDFYGSNIFDKHYFTAYMNQPLAAALGVNNTTTGNSLYRGYLGDPRVLGIRLSTKF